MLYRQLLENVQRRATKIVPELKELSYQERLKALNLPTLYYRRMRYDLIQLYKIISNIEDTNIDKFGYLLMITKQEGIFLSFRSQDVVSLSDCKLSQ